MFSFSRYFLKLLVIVVISISILVAIEAGTLKTMSEIKWLDVLGEGGIFLMTLSWLVAILVSRPAGTVTNYLVLGLLAFLTSSLFDLCDEFVRVSSSNFLSWFESLPAPVGLLLLSYGLYHWHREQMSINEVLRKREYGVREYSAIDPITGLYRGVYMHDFIKHQLEQRQCDFCLAALDLNDFGTFNQHNGYIDGDRFLRNIAELILMNSRLNDLVCRYAGDRFIIYLPSISIEDAEAQLQQIEAAIANLSFKSQQQQTVKQQTVSCVLVQCSDSDTVESLFFNITERFERLKTASQRELRIA